MDLEVCIVCLTSNIKIHSIMNTHLQEVYEKLTSNKLNQEHGQSVCYICCSQLQRSYRFMETSKQADKKLKQLLHCGNEITHDTIALLKNETPQCLGVSMVHSISLSGCSDDDSEMGKFVDENLVTVKSEPLEIEAEIEKVEFNKDTVKKEFGTNEERNNPIQTVFIQIKLETTQKADDDIVKTEQDNNIKDEKHDEQIPENSQKFHSTSKNNSSIDIYCYCDYCNKKCLIKSELEKHMKVHDPRRNHVCKLCGFRFRQLIVLIQHEYYSHGIQDSNIMSADKPFSCIVCKKTFLFEDKLKLHLKNHTVDKLYNCDVCDKNLMSKKSLGRHMRIHNSEKAYTCKICNKTCDSISNMRNHVRIHTGEKPFACNLCDKTYYSKSTLKTHTITNHSQDDEAQRYACESCPKKFPNKTKLAIHMRSHTGDKPYSCTECGKSFALAHSLKTHKRTHTGEKPFACDTCDKTFNQSSQLKLHKRFHTGEKPYSCKLCDKAFAEMGKLRIHMVNHTGEKLACDKCDSTFTTQSSKKRHMLRIHGGKPFSCEQCDKSFSVLPSLESHIKVIHAGEKPFACNKCNKSYSEKKGLNKHIMKVHVDSSDDEKDEKPFVELSS